MKTKSRTTRSEHPQASPPVGLQSLLVAVDLSPASDRVLGRVARLPLREGAVVTLLHVVPGGLSPLVRRQAERDARRLLSEEARQLARALTHRVQLRPVVEVGGAAAEITDIARAQGAELIVMGRGGGRALRDNFLGSTAERVMRATRVPVLAVRVAPRAAYRRPAMAVDLDDSVGRVLSCLLRLLPSSPLDVEVIHAFEAPYGGRIYPSLAADELREQQAELQGAAARALVRRLSEAGVAQTMSTGSVRWKMNVRSGPPRAVVKQVVAKLGADLLAMGTHGYSGLSHAFLGSVAGDLLRSVGCDVLLVPPASAPKE